MAAAKTTTDRDIIRRWIEERGGVPATVKTTHSIAETGIIRVAFNRVRLGKDLEALPWDDFFEKFDEAGLAFLYQDKKADGSPSRFFKFVKRSHPRLAA